MPSIPNGCTTQRFDGCVLEHILPIDIPWYSHLLVGGAITILKNLSQWEGLSHI